MIKRSTVWLIGAGLLAVVLVAAVVLIVRGVRGPAPQAACKFPAPAPSAPATPPGQAPGGGAVRIAEQGFSPTVRPGGVSMAAVLENTSRAQVAYRTKVTFEIDDATGHSAGDPASATSLIFEVPVILPGQRVGVATTTALATDTAGRPRTASRLVTHLDQTHWLPRSGAGAVYQPATATVNGVETKTVTASVTFTVTSDYQCDRVWRHWVMVLYRDHAGKLVGGMWAVDGIYTYCPKRGAALTEHRGLIDRPRDLDPARTEAYAYCDPTSGTSDPDAPGSNYQVP